MNYLKMFVVGLGLVCIAGQSAYPQKRFSGQSILSTIRMAPDKTPPVVYFVSPKLNLREAVQVFRPVMRIQGYIQDENPVTSLTINGEVLTLNHDGTFSVQIQLSTGENLLSIEASDTKGNILREAYPLVLLTDTQAPLVELAPKLQSDKPFRTHATQFTLSGTIRDENELRHFKVNGIPVPLQQEEFQTTFSLLKGKNIVQVEAEDAFGNRHEAQYEVFAEEVGTDISAPQITLIEPELEMIRGMSGKVVVQ
ncbi:MAG TPA: hypothetical protein PLL64_14560, partial [Rhodothermales bacterium]|nr:hypothetical protein [Rhodothermales bacterium]